MRGGLLAALAALLLVPAAGFAQSQGSIRVDQPWARATAPHQDTAVAYMTLISASGDRLLGATTQAAAHAMLHATQTRGDTSGMVDLDGLDLAPNVPASLAPHGAHLMLIGLKEPLKVGDTLTVTLNFSRAGAVQVAIPVLPIGAQGPVDRR